MLSSSSDVFIYFDLCMSYAVGYTLILEKL